MMSKLQTIMIVIGMLGSYATISGITPINPDNPTPVPIVPILNPFPSAPTNPSVLPLANQITAKLINKADALVIASTFRDWGKFLVSDTDIRNTGEFREVFQNATKIFFTHTAMMGKYPGLDTTISNIITESLRGSHPSLLSGKENVALNPTIRESYKSAMNAISWGAYEASK